MSSEQNSSGKQGSAEAEVEGFRAGLGPFVIAAETTRMPMVFTNAKASNAPIIFVNQAFLTLTGYDEDEVLGQNFNFMMERNTDPEALTEIATAFGGARDLQTEVPCRRKNGSLVWVAIFISPVWDESRNVVQHFASFMDITQHKGVEDRLRLLQDELTHRAQNTIAVVQDAAEQTFRGLVADHVVDDFKKRVREATSSWMAA